MPNIFFILGGLFFSGGSLYLLRQNYRYAWKGIKTTGTIVELVQSSSKGEYGATFSPRVKFRDQLNREHVILSELGLSGKHFSAGNKITIYFNPEKPEQISIVSAYFNFIAGFFFCLGLGIILIGIFVD